MLLYLMNLGGKCIIVRVLVKDDAMMACEGGGL